MREPSASGSLACVAIEVENRPGTLRDALSAFADHDLDPPDAASLAAAALAERPAVAALLPPGTIAALDAAAPIDQIRSAAQSLLAAVRG